MRILLVSDYYPPFIGGAHRQTQLLAHELQQRGHTVTVATMWQENMPAIEDDHGTTVHRIKELRTLLPRPGHKRQHHHPPYADPVAIWGLRRVIRQVNPDIVHSFGWVSYSCAVALLGTKIPMMLSARDYGYSCATRTFLYQNKSCSGPALSKCLHCASQFYGTVRGPVAVLSLLLNRPLLRRRANGIHSVSAFVQKVMTETVFKPSLPKAVIPSFREDVEPQKEIPTAALEKLPKTPFILFVGALQVRKGICQLLEAYARLDSPPPLVMIGTVERDTPREFPPGIVIINGLPHAAVMAAWERCLFGVLPSLWPEPLGSVVYEGMSKAKPVIGTFPGGHADMITDRKTGLLVPQGDTDALYNAMSELLASPEWRDTLGAAARERSEIFTARVSVPRFEALYQEIIHSTQETAHVVHQIGV